MSFKIFQGWNPEVPKILCVVPETKQYVEYFFLFGTVPTIIEVLDTNLEKFLTAKIGLLETYIQNWRYQPLPLRRI